MSRKKPVKKMHSQPSLTSAISTVDGRAELIQKEIGELNVELKKCGGQMKGMRDGPSKDMVKRKAKRILSKKREYERQLERSRTQSFNLEQASYAMQNVRDTRTTMDALNSGRKAMKKEFKKVSISEIEETMDEAAALMEQSNEIQQVLGRSYSLHNYDYSEEDVEAQLDALGDDFLEDEDTSYLDNTVNALEPNSVVPGKPQHLMDVQDEHDDPEIGANGNPSSSDRRNNEDQEPGIGVVPIPIPIPVPVVAPLVIPAVVPVPAPPVPSVPLSKFSNKKSGDKPSRKKKNKEKKKKRKKDKKKNRKEDKNDKDKKKRKTEQDERDAEEPDRDNSKECEEDDHCDKEDDRDLERLSLPHSNDSSSDSDLEEEVRLQPARDGEEEKKGKKKESRWKKFKRKFSLKRKTSSKSHPVQRQSCHVESDNYSPSTAGTEQQHTLMNRPMEDNSEINMQNNPSPSRQLRQPASPPPPQSHSDHQHEMDSLAASNHRGSHHGKTSTPPTRPPPHHTIKLQDHKPPLHRSYSDPSSSSRPQHSESPSTPVHPLPRRTKSLGNDSSFRPTRTAPPPLGTHRQYTDDSHQGHTPQQDVTSQQCNKEDVQEKEFLPENDQFAEKYYSPDLEPDYLPGSEKDNMPEQDYIPPTATYSRFCTLY
jgi:charged multivesicular body protein 5